MWIILVVLGVCAVLWIIIRYMMAINKHRNAIASLGGIKNIFLPLIKGLLEYQSARIVQDKKDYLMIAGTFIDPISYRECGQWSVFIQPAFQYLIIRYRAHVDLGGGMTSKQTWEFPIEMSQEEILTVVKKKADEWDIIGVFK